MIALFGGTFDPIHLGHLHLAKTLLDHYHFEKILFVPAGQNPLKTDAPRASNEDRLQMLKASLKEEEEPRFAVSDVELKRTGKSFTLDTVEKLKKEFPNKEFALILGDEVFKDFSHWHKPLLILKCVHLIIISRSGAVPEIEKTLKEIGATPSQLSDKKWTHTDGKNFVEYFKFDPLPFSSTEVRENIRRLWGIRDLEEKDTLMPQGIQRSVWQVVKVNRLYSVSK